MNQQQSADLMASLAQTEAARELASLAEQRVALAGLAKALADMGYTHAAHDTPAGIIDTATEVIGVLSAYLKTEVRRD